MAESLPVSIVTNVVVGDTDELSSSSSKSEIPQLSSSNELRIEISGFGTGGDGNDPSNQSQGSPGPSILDYSYTGMDASGLDEALSNQPSRVFNSVESILITNNSIIQIPQVISNYKNLRLLDLSQNITDFVCDSIIQCQNLSTLIIRNNFLDENSLPKNFKTLKNLRELNVSGNRFTRIPYEIMELPNLQTLHMGANAIEYISKDISLMKSLEVLYLGGNIITELPNEIGELKRLRVFVISENRLECLPKSVSTLKQLKSLLLHRNRLTALPVELIKLRNLMELSLRDNPLVHKFVRDMVYDPPSLLELAARTVKLRKVQYKASDLPKNLLEYLCCAHQCVNPRCKGVFFDTRVEHIKFVDFCGKYRVPLLEYLCSPKCSDDRSPEFSSSDSDSDDDRIRKVLLG